MKPRYRSLPDFLCTSWSLLWAGLLPQGILALLNLRAWLLVRGEVSVEQAKLFAILGGCQAVLLAALAVLLVVHRMRKRQLGWIACIPLFFVHVAYLWVVTQFMGDLLPQEVTRWMLPPTVFLYSQFTLMMPAVFYFAARVACFPMTNHPLKDIGITAGTVITIPAIWYIGLRVLSGWFRFGGPEFVWTLFWVVSTVLTIMAFLRLLMMAYKWTCGVQRHRWIFILLAALAMPLGGLALNATIPFPVDLQYPVIYVLTVLNAAVLLIPRFERRDWVARVWLARCAMLPFSLYFFLLFLPFLPLSIPAMIAVGSGFLILAPTFLFAIHIQLLVDEGREVAAVFGRTRTLLCVVAALALIPGLLTIDALLDRRNLTAAIDAVYTPDTLSQPRISAHRAARALKRLDADKRGVYLPFISGAYRKLVFDGMVLQDRKIAEMIEIFTGEPFETEDSHRNRNAMFDLWTGWRGTTRGRSVPPPPRTVTLQTTDVARVEADGMVTATVALTLANANRSNAEYVTRLELSPGVLVSGYWLDVEGGKKSGRLYEKRAAMWVYHMIRDVTRRDPGLLIYEAPQTLKLNVYPFATNQIRRTGIEFLFPAGLPATVTVDGTHLDLAPTQTTASTTPVLLGSDSASHRVLAIAGTETAKEPAVERTPLIHILIDRSAASGTLTAGQWQDRLSALEARLPRDARYHVAAVNHSTHMLTDTPVDFVEARSAIAAIEKIKPQGGVAHHQAIRRGIAAWREQALPVRRESVPLFLLLTSPGVMPTPIESLSGLAVFTPDVEGYWKDNGDALTYHAYHSTQAVSAERISPPHPVCFPMADSADCVRSGQPATLLVHGADADIKGARARVRSELADRYVTGMALWSQWNETIVNPSLLDEHYAQLVADSRSAGIMLPVTSFMVVENSAQEEMLERKHREATEAKSALDFDEHQESPEPGFWLMLIPVMLLATRRRRAACA
jgi:hypothetical protein